MTSPPEPFDVDCPQCGLAYRAWLHASVNLALERAALEGGNRSPAQTEQALEELVEEMTTATCPACRHVVRGEALLVDWEDAE
jgi:endogenous inhibitor of DNA gyrase (YacG/DUF329 family)